MALAHCLYTASSRAQWLAGALAVGEGRQAVLILVGVNRREVMQIKWLFLAVAVLGAQAAQAHELMNSSQHIGKIMLKVKA